MGDLLVWWNKLEGSLGQWTAQIYRMLFPEKSVERFYRKRLRAALLTALLAFFWCIRYAAQGGVGIRLLWIAAIPAASFLPYLDLLLAGQFYLARTEEEINLYRFLALLLAGACGATVETILEWMERFGHYFQAEVAVYLDRGEVYRKEEEGVLSPAALPDGLLSLFRSLTTADRVGLAAAFRGVALQREFQIGNEKQRYELEAGKKAAWIQIILLLPFGIAVAGYLILPFLEEGIKNLLTFTEMGV